MGSVYLWEVKISEMPLNRPKGASAKNITSMSRPRFARIDRSSRCHAGVLVGLDGCEVRLCDPCAHVCPCVPMCPVWHPRCLYSC